MRRATRRLALFGDAVAVFSASTAGSERLDGSALLAVCAGAGTAVAIVTRSATAVAAATCACIVRELGLAAASALAGEPAMFGRLYRKWRRRYRQAANRRSLLPASCRDWRGLFCWASGRCGLRAFPESQLARRAVAFVERLAGCAVADARTSTTLRGTMPYRTGKGCYMAVRRYTRYPENPADGLATVRRTDNKMQVSIIHLLDIAPPDLRKCLERRFLRRRSRGGAGAVTVR